MACEVLSLLRVVTVGDSVVRHEFGLICEYCLSHELCIVVVRLHKAIVLKQL